MVERICPTCQHGNSLDHHFCGKCGAQLERLLPAPPSNTAITVAGRHLPVTWQQLGKTVALSAAAVAAEVGLAWLRQRTTNNAPSIVNSLVKQAITPAKQTDNTALSQAVRRSVTIVSQRVLEVWDNGDGQRQVVERHIWRRTEE